MGKKAEDAVQETKTEVAAAQQEVEAVKQKAKADQVTAEAVSVNEVATKKAEAKAGVKAKVKAEVKAKVANAVSKSTLSYSDLKLKLIGAKSIVDNIITDAEKTKANAESAVINAKSIAA